MSPLQVVASNISPEDVSELRAQFHKIDVDGDGSISAEELKRVVAGQMEAQQLQVGASTTSATALGICTV